MLEPSPTAASKVSKRESAELENAVNPDTESICTWAELEITPSKFNLDFTFESKLVIESALTWTDEEITPSAFNLVFTRASVK